jgi:L-lactate dehydrogenase complex protein LldG
MNDRDRILAAIRRHAVAAQPLPATVGTGIRYQSPVNQFVDVLQLVGGQVQRVSDGHKAARAIAQLPQYQTARHRCCEVALPRDDGAGNLLDWNVQLDQVQDPHDLADLDFVVLPGEFAVAENGAVWVTDRQLRHRVVYFVAQHVAIVVPETQIVHNMHDAYARLEFADNAYGCFVSGPSKTADIEQSLVIGAHGARSLTVLLVQEDASCGFS